MKIKATVDKYCYTIKPTDSDAKKWECVYHKKKIIMI